MNHGETAHQVFEVEVGSLCRSMLVDPDRWWFPSSRAYSADGRPPSAPLRAGYEDQQPSGQYGCQLSVVSAVVLVVVVVHFVQHVV